MITEEQRKELFAKLIQLDEYSKSIGITLYDITYGCTENGKDWTHKICGFNIQPQEDVPEFKSFVECLKHADKSTKQAD